MKKLFAVLLLVAFVGAFTAPLVASNNEVISVVIEKDKDKKKASKKETKATKTEAACCTETKKEAACCTTNKSCTGTCTEMKKEEKK